MNESFLTHLKAIFTQVFGYLAIAVMLSIIKLAFIKEDGSIWSKIQKFTASIIFAMIVGFILDGFDITTNIKYAVVGAATLIADKLIIFWVEGGLEYVKTFLSTLLTNFTKNKQNDSNGGN